jgi:hypothetical protein
MHILYPTVGRHPTKGRIDFRWKYTGKRGFLVAFGPCSCRSFWRASVWFFGQRRRNKHSVFQRSTCGNEREERAFEALIVSQLRAPNDDEPDMERLPILSSKEQQAMDSLGSDFVERLLEGKIDKRQK